MREGGREGGKRGRQAGTHRERHGAQLRHFVAVELRSNGVARAGCGSDKCRRFGWCPVACAGSVKAFSQKRRRNAPEADTRALRCDEWYLPLREQWRMVALSRGTLRAR